MRYALIRSLALSLLLLLLVPRPSLAQAGATVSGRAVDATNGSRIAFATVVIRSAQSGEPAVRRRRR